MESLWQTFFVFGEETWEQTHLQHGDEIAFCLDEGEGVWDVKVTRAGEDGRLLAMAFMESEHGHSAVYVTVRELDGLRTLDALSAFLSSDLGGHGLAAVAVFSNERDEGRITYTPNHDRRRTSLKYAVFALSKIHRLSAR